MFRQNIRHTPSPPPKKASTHYPPPPPPKKGIEMQCTAEMLHESVYRQDGTLEYSGEWKQNRKHGMGTLYHKDGTTVQYKGVWKDGLEHGPGTLSDSTER